MPLVRLDRMLVARRWPLSCSYFGIEGLWCRWCSMRVEMRRYTIQGDISHWFILQTLTTFLVFMLRNVGFTFLRTGGGACSRNLAHLIADCSTWMYVFCKLLDGKFAFLPRFYSPQIPHQWGYLRDFMTNIWWARRSLHTREFWCFNAGSSISHYLALSYITHYFHQTLKFVQR